MQSKTLYRPILAIVVVAAILFSCGEDKKKEESKAVEKTVTETTITNVIDTGGIDTGGVVKPVVPTTPK